MRPLTSEFGAPPLGSTGASFRDEGLDSHLPRCPLSLNTDTSPSVIRFARRFALRTPQMEQFLPSVDEKAKSVREAHRAKQQEGLRNSEEQLRVTELIQQQRNASEQETSNSLKIREIVRTKLKDFYNDSEYKQLQSANGKLRVELHSIRIALTTAHQALATMEKRHNNKRKELELTELVHDGGERKGFFLGDGAGMGKGRTLAGFIAENYSRGR